ncbi:nitrate reductase molybdenum cofactor assembly chaperone [Agromyces sp. NPDC058104]|uniref:nitrate reductase molybdenum cofactor assembly chaperone n=1 Tax=Agromyces sp. NPDC058104 TaxID=3346342 RepID=UPI0036DEB29C
MANFPLIFRRSGSDATRSSRGPATAPLALDDATRRLAHIAASLLLDYPDEGFDARVAAVEASLGELPPAIAGEFRDFIDHAAASDREALAIDYVATFDLKRKCCMYLSYYAAGDTRRRGTALVTFVQAYRAAGWEFDADELPDYLPAVLEFSARSDSPVASELLAAHRDGLEVLREALEKQRSPWAGLVRAVCRSLPELDEATRERYLELVSQGPHAETVGLSFIGGLGPTVLAPYQPVGAAHEEARA